MGFSDSLKLAILETQEKVNDSVVDTFIEFANKGVDYSPTQVEQDHTPTHAKGLFANSWYVGVNEMDSTVGTIADESASGSKQRITSLKLDKSFMFKDGYISLSNNLDYAYLVEYGWPTGASPYAPLRNSITYIMGDKKT